MSVLTLDDLTVPAPEPGPADWNDDGVVVLPGFIPGGLLDDYAREWKKANGYHGRGSRGACVANRPGGWPDAIPYMRNHHLRALCCNGPLGDQIEALIGEPAGVHLNLTGWVSTQRDWHQDTYLNPTGVGDSYAAVWIALDDVHPDSGPFQYVPGSHRWHRLDRAKMLAALSPEERDDPRWPTYSQRLLTPLYEAEFERRGVGPVTYLPKRGDVLIWHSRLVHRGSVPNVAGMERRALIAHYSGIHHRQDMPAAVRHPRGGWFFPLAGSTPVR